MTEADMLNRLQRIRAAMGDARGPRVEDPKLTVVATAKNFLIRQDFTGGRTQSQLDKDVGSVINEIMPLRDRAKSWLKSKGGEPKEVDAFIKLERAVALVHDLANLDKHGQSGRDTFSGDKPTLGRTGCGMALKYDPAVSTYAPTGIFTGPGVNIKTGEQTAGPSGSGTEITPVADILDEKGDKIGEIQKTIPDAIYKWEILRAKGLAI